MDYYNKFKYYKRISDTYEEELQEKTRYIKQLEYENEIFRLILEQEGIDIETIEEPKINVGSVEEPKTEIIQRANGDTYKIKR